MIKLWYNTRFLILLSLLLAVTHIFSLAIVNKYKLSSSRRYAVQCCYLSGLWIRVSMWFLSCRAAGLLRLRLLSRSCALTAPWWALWIVTLEICYRSTCVIHTLITTSTSTLSCWAWATGQPAAPQPVQRWDARTNINVFTPWPPSVPVFDWLAGILSPQNLIIAWDMYFIIESSNNNSI